MSTSRSRPRIVLLLLASIVTIAIAGVGFAGVTSERAPAGTGGEVEFATPPPRVLTAHEHARQ
ncbi:hypothetical protein [Conexibacter woesei]|uniref:Uncharacterized protein n=1 Tax=Conexibacter woesei (strain DSM 14684 / CCUG 47730 / CIP 108061 / JCM 11494 / NBRC 100937 / ID131577) TaxID=469383 RepID=D3FBW3_CONWI|nr:hypothetical protein [Conexibacter woesei]ADB51378.1 hypothetical protein Cwoe_2959 [Conexibacter woesei DSM 14684]